MQAFGGALSHAQLETWHGILMLWAWSPNASIVKIIAQPPDLGIDLDVPESEVLHYFKKIQGHFYKDSDLLVIIFELLLDDMLVLEGYVGIFLPRIMALILSLQYPLGLDRAIALAEGSLIFFSSPATSDLHILGQLYQRKRKNRLIA
ncbi:hypothetical protein ACJX0J_033583, partial [Zea mays]